MATDQKRRQKKLMKKRRKDKARKKKKSASAPYALLSQKRKILSARKLPIYECLINPSWREDGLATILISRRQQDGRILFGVYLVDVFCLGLKNTFCNADFSVWSYETQVRPRIHAEEDLEDCPVALAHWIIYGAIEFARRLGFSPQKDFELSQFVLEERNSIEPCEDVVFGRNGEPCYIAGPDDDVERIMKRLESSVGKGNFKFTAKADQFTF